MTGGVVLVDSKLLDVAPTARDVNRGHLRHYPLRLAVTWASDSKIALRYSTLAAF